MAHATHLTIATGDRIRLSFPTDSAEDGNEIHQEVQVSVTYALDPKDTDLTALAAEKADEVKRAHEAAWHRIGAFGSQCASAGSPESSGMCSCRRNGNNDAVHVSGQPPMRQRDDLRPLSGTTPANSASGRFDPQTAAPAESPRTGFPQNRASGTPHGGNGNYAAPARPEMASKPQKILIRAKCHAVGLTTAGLEEVLWKQYRLRSVERLSKAQAAAVIQGLERYEKTGRIEIMDPALEDNTAEDIPQSDEAEKYAEGDVEESMDDDWEPQDADVPAYA